MIRSFRRSHTERLFGGFRVRKFQSIEKTAIRKLFQLDQARTLSDLRSPGNSLEALGRDRIGQHSIRINDQYRLCFVWKIRGDQGDAYDVEIVDYH